MRHMKGKRVTDVADLHPLVRIGSVSDAAATVTCPRCGHENPIRWDENDRLVWWNVEGTHCRHYRGAYSAGDINVVQVEFR